MMQICPGVPGACTGGVPGGGGGVPGGRVVSGEGGARGRGVPGEGSARGRGCPGYARGGEGCPGWGAARNLKFRTPGLPFCKYRILPGGIYLVISVTEALQ